MGFSLSLIAFLMMTSQAVATTCASVAGYYDNGAGVCWATQPSIPTPEFSTAQWPVCGAGRIALSGDGSYTASTFSSSGLPAWNGTAYSYGSGSDNQNFSYTSSSNPSAPIYGFPPGWRCYCMSTGSSPATYAPAAAAATPTLLSNTISTPSTALRQYPVTFDVINSQTQLGNVLYAPVPIDKNPTTDGRIYGEVSGGNAVCSCPNINEIIKSNGTDSGNWVGNYCIPMVNNNVPTGTTQSARVLTLYNSAIHFGSKILSNAVDTSTPMASTLLPNSGADQVGTSLYMRRIWTCADPYVFDSSSPVANCVFTRAQHACDDGTTISTQPSAVSDLIAPSPSPYSSANQTAQFNHTVNRKLACCLNAFHLDSSDTYEKFDCIDNSQQGYADFDTLWSSSDPVADGEQMNAILLSDGMSMVTGKARVISGFYGLDGRHCDQFSEFAYPAGGKIQGYRVDPKMLSGQQVTVGGVGYVSTSIAHALPTSANYATIQALVVAAGKSVPATQQDMLTCPILVRAAIITSCPSSTIAPNALTTYNDQATPMIRCPVAGGIQIHLRIEQIFEITGTAPVVPFDSFSQVNATTSLDVSKIILDKVGDQCPPGTTKKGDLCSY